MGINIKIDLLFFNILKLSIFLKNMESISDIRIQKNTYFCIPVKSDTSPDIYQVQILFNNDLKTFDLDCTCRLKYNLTTKRKCKHIARCVHSILSKYSELNASKKEFEISSIFSNLKI